MFCTWHAHVEVGEGDFSSGCPFEEVFVSCVGKASPEILFRSQTHQTDQESILISVFKYIYKHKDDPNNFEMSPLLFRAILLICHIHWISTKR